MSNSYFQFKKFTIEQDRCAMKVSTDACLQGAWAPVVLNARSVLDIGTGTGLLSLMIAQQFPELTIDAIELDEAAAGQASENVRSSPFAGRINVFQGDINNWNSEKKFDFIVCNPPFFINSLKGPEAKRNSARHDVSLSQQQLVSVLKDRLLVDGHGCFLWPIAEHQEWEKVLKAAGVYLEQILLIKDSETSNVKRVISTCSFQKPETTSETTLIIKQSDGTYTDDFIALLQPFYLKL